MKIRLAVAVVLLLICFAGWYAYISNVGSVNKKYDSYIENARYQKELNVFVESRDSYLKAIELKDSVEVRLELLDLYKTFNKDADYEVELNNLIELYPEEKKGYELLCEYYAEKDEISNLFETARTMKKRAGLSDTTKRIVEENKYKYQTEWEVYDKLEPYSGDFCKVELKEGKVGYLNLKGKNTVKVQYQKGSGFNNSGYAAIIDMNGEAYIIDKNGDKKSTTLNMQADGRTIVPASEITFYSQNKVAVCMNGKYRYFVVELQKTDEDGNVVKPKIESVEGEYLVAGSFNNERAAVKTEGGWSIIDGSFKQVSSKSYEDVILDEKGIAFRGKRAFVKEGGKYYLVDTELKMVNDTPYDDAVCFFESDGYAAIKIGDLWGFIDINGKMVLNAAYEDARSFCNGIAGVKINGKWGFIDTKGKVVIEPVFEEVYELNSKNMIPVKTESGWQLIKIMGEEL